MASMKRLAVLLILILPLPMLGCGGSGGFDPTPEQLAAALCASGSLGTLSSVFLDVFEFLGSIGNGPLPAGATYDDVTGAYSLATALGTITGTLTSPDDISDGIDPFESASATWDLNGGVTAGSTILGSGVFDVTRASATLFEITGGGAIDDPGCSFDGSSLDLTLDLNSSLGPQGTLGFTLTTAAGTYVGTMRFDGSSTARVTGTFNGESFAFRIDLDTFTPY
jgi:hypothetical protein